MRRESGWWRSSDDCSTKPAKASHHMLPPPHPPHCPSFPAAAEQIVIPRGQPVELLPRDLDTIDAQALLVEEFGLPYEVVGGTASLRLRVLPPAWASRGPDAGSSATPSSEGARKKEFW